MATNLKLQLGDDIRRLNISQLSNYTEFCELARAVFNIPALNSIQMAYQDEEKDWINIRSEMDMAEAREYAVRLPSFKINVTVGSSISSSPVPAEASYPQVAPEDIDLTSSFADLMTDSMQIEKKAESASPAPAAATSTSFVLPIPGAAHAKPADPVAHVPHNPPQSPASPSAPNASDVEAEFHKSLDELSAAQEQEAETSIGVLSTVESKIKKALDALVQFMESLKLDDKMKQIVTELEPSFAKLDANIIQPLETFSQRASRNIQTEIQEFQVQVNELKDRLQQRLVEIRSRPSSPVLSRAHAAPAAPAAAPAPAHPVVQPSAPLPEAHHNAMKDLQTLESMGFSDRRRNLELLASHKGNLALVIDQLLTDAQ